jgi:hypothetical protein
MGKTPEQKKALKYFNGSFLTRLPIIGGLFRVKDAAYDEIVKQVRDSYRIRERALAKIGLDESQVSEIKPVNFEGFDFDKGSGWRIGKDGMTRSSKYEVTWIFFSDSQIFMYKFNFSMIEDKKSEKTEEYFYKDVTNFSTGTETYEYTNVGGRKFSTEAQTFAIVVPGDKFRCSVTNSSDIEGQIQAMKAKLREKKMS